MLVQHTKLCIFVTNPVECPVSLLFYTRHCLNSVEQKFSTGEKKPT